MYITPQSGPNNDINHSFSSGRCFNSMSTLNCRHVTSSDVTSCDNRLRFLHHRFNENQIGDRQQSYDSPVMIMNQTSLRIRMTYVLGMFHVEWIELLSLVFMIFSRFVFSARDQVVKFGVQLNFDCQRGCLY